MRTINTSQITDTIANLSIDANYYLADDVYQSLSKGAEEEESALGRDILRQLLKNACIARTEDMPICQDTGMAVVFVELGQDVHIVGGDINDAINAGVAKGYTGGYLRKSVVNDPVFVRKNTGDNTPAIIHLSIVPGDKIKLTLAPKGFGSENMRNDRQRIPFSRGSRIHEKNGSVYFAAIGGAGALIAKSIKKYEVVVYPDLLSEAVACLTVEDFPAIVVIDSQGRNYYEEGQKKYKK